MRWVFLGDRDCPGKTVHRSSGGDQYEFLDRDFCSYLQQTDSRREIVGDVVKRIGKAGLRMCRVDQVDDFVRPRKHSPQEGFVGIRAGNVFGFRWYRPSGSRASPDYDDLPALRRKQSGHPGSNETRAAENAATHRSLSA